MQLPSETSPFAYTNPSSIQGLLMRQRFGHKLTPRDLAPALEANADLIADDNIRALFLAVLKGETGRKGRPRRPMGRGVQLCAIEEKIEKRAQEIRAERAARPAGQKRRHGEFEPKVQAAEEYKHLFSYATGRALLNDISRFKKNPLF